MKCSVLRLYNSAFIAKEAEEVGIGGDTIQYGLWELTEGGARLCRTCCQPIRSTE